MTITNLTIVALITSINFLVGTYIVYPDELADARVGLHLALKVHVHSLSDVGRVDVATETDAHRG